MLGSMNGSDSAHLHIFLWTDALDGDSMLGPMKDSMLIFVFPMNRCVGRRFNVGFCLRQMLRPTTRKVPPKWESHGQYSGQDSQTRTTLQGHSKRKRRNGEEFIEQRPLVHFSQAAIISGASIFLSGCVFNSNFKWINVYQNMSIISARALLFKY